MMQLRLLALLALLGLSACGIQRNLELPGHEKYHAPKPADPDDEGDDESMYDAQQPAKQPTATTPPATQGNTK